MAGDLTRCLDRVRVHHDQLLVVDAQTADRPARGSESIACRSRPLIAVDLVGLPEAQRVRQPWQPVQILMLLAP